MTDHEAPRAACRIYPRHAAKKILRQSAHAEWIIRCLGSACLSKVIRARIPLIDGCRLSKNEMFIIAKRPRPRNRHCPDGSDATPLRGARRLRRRRRGRFSIGVNSAKTGQPARGCPVLARMLITDFISCHKTKSEPSEAGSILKGGAKALL